MPVTSPDAVIVGSGPNGLAAAIVLAQAGLTVSVYEAKETLGGGARTAEITLPGFRHDICSAIHPMSVVSPFIKTLPLAEHGLEWAYSPLAIAHPLDDGTAAILEQSVDATAEHLGEDAKAYRKLMSTLAKHAIELYDEILRPIRLIPHHPLLMARFGVAGLQPATRVAKRFRTEKARALLAGSAAHSFLPLSHAGSTSFALALMLAGHATGWPAAKGGSQSIIDAMASYLRSMGCTFETNRRVRSMRGS